MPFKLFISRVDVYPILLLTLILTSFYPDPAISDPEEQARDIIKQAIEHYRGLSSYSEMTMTIHRPDWERKMSLQGWSSGGKKTLIRMTAPPRPCYWRCYQ